jgi:hypothetical protein
MRIILIVLLAIHGLIHLFGFLKAFGYASFDAIKQPISGAMGLIWLLPFVLLITAATLSAIQSAYWWLPAMVGVLISQLLIFSYWSDAKYGTILNIAILLPAIIALSTFLFHRKVKKEVAEMSAVQVVDGSRVLTAAQIAHLPDVVQAWLISSGAVNKEMVYRVYLEQQLEMQMQPDREGWNKAVAKQHFTVDPPAFNWSVQLNMNPLVSVVGRDRFENGEGEMLIKIFSLFPIANAGKDEKVNQASLQRYLAEIVWFPSAALSPYISWEAAGPQSARATLEYKGTKGTGTFYFDEDGLFEKFVAMRFKDSKDKEPKEWTVMATKSEVRNGIRIPVECEASWQLEDRSWNWLKLRLKDIRYNAS